MITNLRPYSAYKDAGVEWLGRVPAHWEVRRLRYIVEMRASNVDKHSKEGEEPVRLCNYVDVYKHERIRANMEFMKATASVEEFERFRLEQGDVLITKDSEAWDDIGVPALIESSAPDLISGYHLALLRPKQVVEGALLLRALQSPLVAYQFHVEAKGVTRYGLSHDAIKSTLVPLPPLPEQTAIVRFLDYVDRRIRQVIRARQRRIKLLEEYKQALIHQAVTGSIDVRTGKPYPAYKDSGVEWLGKVPEHWEVRRLKHVAHIHTGGTPAGLLDEAFDENGIPWVKPDHLLADKGLLDPDRRLSIKAAQSIGIIKRGSLLVCGIGSVGKVGFAPYDLCTNQQINAITFSRAVFERFGHFLGLCLAQEFVKRSNKVTIAICNKSQMGEVSICVPPLNQQTAIVEYLDAQTAKIDAAIAAARREIELLREYRTRLIADVVTGKVDVREVAARLPEEPDEEDALWTDDEERAQGETLNGEDDHVAISEEDE